MVLKGLQDRGDVQVVAASDVNPAAREAVKQHFGSIRFTTDFEEVTGSEDVDLVLILSSGPEHGRIALVTLQAGKHVLVEKPMASTLEVGAKLVELARDQSLYLLPAPHVILSPTFQIIWKRVLQGDIGKVLLARARYGLGKTLWSDWFYRAGTNALFELAVYNITSLTGLIGPAKRVTAMSGIALPERQLDGNNITVTANDNAQVLIDFGESVFGAVTTGMSMHDYRSPALELYGSDGVMQMLGDDWAPEGYELWKESTRYWQHYRESDPLWHWTDGLVHLVECIQQRKEPVITPEHAFHVLEIMVRAEEAASDGRTRIIESTFPALRLDAANIDTTLVGSHSHAPATLEQRGI